MFVQKKDKEIIDIQKKNIYNIKKNNFNYCNFLYILTLIILSILMYNYIY